MSVMAAAVLSILKNPETVVVVDGDGHYLIDMTTAVAAAVLLRISRVYARPLSPLIQKTLGLRLVG